MKYHYQFVSNTTVRIELIAANQKETRLIELLQTAGHEDQKLKAIFETGLAAYVHNASIKKLSFMNFPKVALCSYEKTTIIHKSTAL